MSEHLLKARRASEGNRTKVLVLGDDDRSCLAVVRSLGRQQITVLLGTQTPDSIVKHSRYVTRTILLPSTETQTNLALKELQDLLMQEPVALVIPCSDTTLVPLFRHRSEFEPLAPLAIPNSDGFEHSYFKDKTLALARQLGVPIPTTILIENMSDLDRVESNPEFLFPLIVKPISSKVWTDGTRVNLQVRSVHEWSALVRVAQELLEIAPVLIQNYFRGVGVGQEFLAHEGVIINAFQHERVHEPLGGGGSSYRKSVSLDQRMLGCSRKLLSHLCWTGVAMVEYKKNPVTGEFVLMEINGRFWGSLPLAVAAGVDFPYHLYQMVVNKQRSTPSAYKVGLYCRNLRNDAGWFKERLQVASYSPVTVFALLKEILRGLRNVFLGRERFDAITLDDPLPGLIQIWHDSYALAKRSLGWMERGVWKCLASNAIWRRRQRSKFRQLLDGRRHLLFVCRGNICRSPFAEAYATGKLNALGMRELVTASAGTYPLAKRRAPEFARLASQEFGVTLDDHRSRVLEPQLIQWADAVVCMDYRDHCELRRVFPNAKRKLFFLRPFDATAKDFQITDPWGQTADDFRVCYQRISSSMEGLIQTLVN